MQLSIFDVADSPALSFGDEVQVINVNKGMDVETYFYLQDLQGKRGKVTKVIKCPTLQYEVDFNGHTAIVYHTELK